MGNGFALTKSLLREVPYTANSITEDLEYHLKLIGKGFRVRFVRQTRVLADFPVSKEGNDTQRSRWEGGRFMLQRRFMFPLLGRVLSGKLRMVEPFLELMSLPLSYEVLALAVLALLPGHPFRIYALAGFATILCQLLAAVLVHGRKRDFLALFQIPAYLAWKVIKLPSILLTSKKNAAWVRTKRD
jgi:cellulose synthase/poly-beta-1,6-N-acetylglucosamine synthase-like glycosyltransferase